MKDEVVERAGQARKPGFNKFNADWMVVIYENVRKKVFVLIKFHK